MAPSAPASSTSTAGGTRRGGVTFAELGRHAGRVTPDGREAPPDGGSSVSAERSIGSRVSWGSSRTAKKRKSLVSNPGRFMDPVTELTDLEQRIRMTVVHPRPCTRHPLWPPRPLPSCVPVPRAFRYSIFSRRRSGARRAAWSLVAASGWARARRRARRRGRPRGVEEEVVAGGDEHHERRVERPDRADEEASTVADQAGGDDQP